MFRSRETLIYKQKRRVKPRSIFIEFYEAIHPSIFRLYDA